MRTQSVMLINMPWCMVHRPSIQLGTLQSVLTRASVLASARSFNLAFADYLVNAEPRAPDDERLTLEDYIDVAERHYSAALGDWIFAVPPFRESDDLDEDYIEYLRTSERTEETILKARRMRQMVPSFLERCVDDVLAASPSVVGFTTTFTQNVPSLVLARLIKSRDPSIQIIFGGSNCDGPMGVALHRAFPFVDVVVRGEAEVVLPELVRDLFDGGAIRPQPGLCYREGEDCVVIEQEGKTEVLMNSVPLPNYDEYFARLEHSDSRAKILPYLTIPFESARGCWWGAKKHCTFCGLNGLTMAFRSKSPDLVIEELRDLARKHQWLTFNAVDNIISMSYFNEFLPKLRDMGFDFKLFYETKANLKKTQLQAMRDAGVGEIQPGIESLSTPILKLMDKGVTALQNIRFLKWCAELGIEPLWNLLYGFPGEPVEEYECMANLMQSITHLTPPHGVHSVVLQRFSPYHQRPGDYGLKVTGPKQYYGLIYPCDESTLNDLAFIFSHSFNDGRDPETYVGSVKQGFDEWVADFGNGANLSYQRGPDFLLIKDRRPALGGCNYSLAETEAKIYLGCDAGSTPMSVWQSLKAGGKIDIDLEDVEDFLAEMAELKLMYEEDGCYLSLAVPAKPRRTTVGTEEPTQKVAYRYELPVIDIVRSSPEQPA